MEFEYILKRQAKTKVCFGSGLEREFLDFDTKGMVSKHARSNIRMNYKNIGPGSYDIIKQTSALSGVLYRPTSKFGTVLGGRKAERKGMHNVESFSPGPIYDVPTMFPNEFKQACAPFNTRKERMKFTVPNVPGVGFYKITSNKRRRAAYAHSFGSKTCLLPAVKMKCGPFNFDTCERCQKFPEGDYWYLDLIEVENMPNLKRDSTGIYLCRPCYDLEKKENKIFSKLQMRKFKKIRDCSKVHFHDGCKAKLFLVSPQEISKVKEREAYLSLYFN